MFWVMRRSLQDFLEALVEDIQGVIAGDMSGTMF